MAMFSEFSGTRNVQLVPGVLYGLRAFYLNADSTLSSPIHTEFEWGEGEQEAACLGFLSGLDRPNHEVGTITCRCGFYSYHSVAHAQEYNPGEQYGMVGVIEAYGRVTVGEQGMRSSRAKIVALVVPRKFFSGRARWPEHRRALIVYRGVKTFPTVKQAARYYGINGRPRIVA